MLNKFNTLSLSFLFLMFVLAWGTTTAFAAETTIYNPSFVMTANRERIEYNVTDPEGNPATIGAECISMRYAEPQEWKIWIVSGIINCKYYIKVSNNKIISASNDYFLQTGGGSSSNESFVWNSQYAKLSFKYTSWGNIISFNFWLQATVTGRDNDVDVTTPLGF